MSPAGNTGTAPESVCMFIIRKAVASDAVGSISIRLIYLAQKGGSEVILSRFLGWIPKEEEEPKRKRVSQVSLATQDNLLQCAQTIRRLSHFHCLSVTIVIFVIRSRENVALKERQRYSAGSSVSEDTA